MLRAGLTREGKKTALRQHKNRDFSPGSAQGQLCHLCGRCPNTGNTNIVIKKIHIVVFSATTLLGLIQGRENFNVFRILICATDACCCSRNPCSHVGKITLNCRNEIKNIPERKVQI